MQPDQFPEQNFTFVKPDSMTDEECTPLVVYRGPHPNGTGHPAIISRWVDPATGQSVFVHVYGYGLPPMYIGAENPFEQNLATNEQRAAFIITTRQLAFNEYQMRWLSHILGGVRKLVLTQETSPANTGKTFFIENFIKPWNSMNPNDTITYKGE